MSSPPLDPRYRPAIDRPSLESVLAGYALVPAFFLSLWIVSQPLTGTVVLAAIGGLFLGVRRARGLVRCFDECGGFSFDLGENVRITIAQKHTDDSS